MDKKILLILEKLEKRLSAIETSMVTKNDAKKFVTKDDLNDLAIKSDLAQLKKDLYQRFDILDKKIDKVDEMQWTIFRSVDGIKSDRVEISRLENRIEKLERKLAT